jgi:lysophospholipase L1-like esterase
MPNEPSWNASWQVAHARNRQLAQAAAQQHGELDVLLLGDSITESVRLLGGIANIAFVLSFAHFLCVFSLHVSKWLGTSLAQPAPKFDENHHVYSDLFDGDDAPAKGLALGIAGDRCAQLLYRLENGEVAPLTSTQKHPKVAWVLIGTNDFLWSSCREEEIVAGNVRVAQTLLRIFPRCTVVLQSLLPVSRSIGGDDLPAKQSREAYRTINRRLDCYAQSTPRVQFANVTGLFLTSRGEINRTMLPDGIHPGGVAAQEWGAAIVEHVQRIVTHIGNQ